MSRHKNECVGRLLSKTNLIGKKGAKKGGKKGAKTYELVSSFYGHI